MVRCYTSIWDGLILAKRMQFPVCQDRAQLISIWSWKCAFSFDKTDLESVRMDLKMCILIWEERLWEIVRVALKANTVDGATFLLWICIVSHGWYVIWKLQLCIKNGRDKRFQQSLFSFYTKACVLPCFGSSQVFPSQLSATRSSSGRSSHSIPFQLGQKR